MSPAGVQLQPAVKIRSSLSSSFAAFACFGLSVPTAGAITIISGLIGGDLTDPEDDGVEGNYVYVTNGIGDDTLGGFNAEFGSNDEPGFGGGEFAFNVFDNRTGAGSDKWCCGQAGGPQIVTATFSQAVSINQFTLTSGNDSVNRDPIDFVIQGTNAADPWGGGTVWTDIYTHTSGDGQIWTTGERSTTARFDGGGVDFADSAFFTTIRMVTTGTQGGSTSGAWFQIGEIEYFGTVIPEPSTFMLFSLAGLALLRRRR